MDASQFEGTNSGQLVHTIEGMRAFLPNRLPPDISLGPIINEFGEASAALGGLSKIGSTISNPYMVIRPLQRNEALRSSAMEGTFSTADELALVEATDEAGSNVSAREVHSYIRAIDFAIKQIETIPISHRVIKGMHKVLFAPSTVVRGSNKRPGEYKVQQNWIGARKIQNARFIPPPPTLALVCMNDLEVYINSATAPIPPLIVTGLCHYQFEAIHPFGDGNGRIGRMLITLQLLSMGLLNSPLLYVSPFIEANKDEYIDSMFAVSSRGDWDRWLRFFLRAIKESCEETSRTIGRLNNLQEHYRQILKERTRSVSALTIADYLFERPVISISDASKRCCISYQSAAKNVERLVSLGILQQVRGFKNPKLFWSKELIDISDR